MPVHHRLPPELFSGFLKQIFQKSNYDQLLGNNTGGPEVVCDLRFQTFKTMYENALKIALKTAYGK